MAGTETPGGTAPQTGAQLLNSICLLGTLQEESRERINNLRTALLTQDPDAQAPEAAQVGEDEQQRALAEFIESWIVEKWWPAADFESTKRRIVESVDNKNMQIRMIREFVKRIHPESTALGRAGSCDPLFDSLKSIMEADDGAEAEATAQATTGGETTLDPVGENETVLTENDIDNMRVVELRAALERRKLESGGLKAQIQARLKSACGIALASPRTARTRAQSEDATNNSGSNGVVTAGTTQNTGGGDTAVVQANLTVTADNLAAALAAASKTAVQGQNAAAPAVGGGGSGSTPALTGAAAPGKVVVGRGNSSSTTVETGAGGAKQWKEVLKLALGRLEDEDGKTALKSLFHAVLPNVRFSDSFARLELSVELQKQGYEVPPDSELVKIVDQDTFAEAFFHVVVESRNIEAAQNLGVASTSSSSKYVPAEQPITDQRGRNKGDMDVKLVQAAAEAFQGLGPLGPSMKIFGQLSVDAMFERVMQYGEPTGKAYPKLVRQLLTVLAGQPRKMYYNGYVNKVSVLMGKLARAIEKRVAKGSAASPGSSDGVIVTEVDRKLAVNILTMDMQDFNARAFVECRALVSTDWKRALEELNGDQNAATARELSKIPWLLFNLRIDLMVAEAVEAGAEVVDGNFSADWKTLVHIAHRAFSAGVKTETLAAILQEIGCDKGGHNAMLLTPSAPQIMRTCLFSTPQDFLRRQGRGPTLQDTGEDAAGIVAGLNERVSYASEEPYRQLAAAMERRRKTDEFMDNLKQDLGDDESSLIGRLRGKKVKRKRPAKKGKRKAKAGKPAMDEDSDSEDDDDEQGEEDEEEDDPPPRPRQSQKKDLDLKDVDESSASVKDMVKMLQEFETEQQEKVILSPQRFQSKSRKGTLAAALGKLHPQLKDMCLYATIFGRKWTSHHPNCKFEPCKGGGATVLLKVPKALIVVAVAEVVVGGKVAAVRADIKARIARS